jgi:hypothetical protein
MTYATDNRLRPAEVIERYGQCLELVPLDRNFHDISVGLYVKDGVCTIWTYSGRDGVDARVRAIRDQMIALGGMAPVENTHNQLQFPCGQLHPRPLRFLTAQAVGKAHDYAAPTGAMSIKDSKSDLTIHVQSVDTLGKSAYNVSLEGEAKNAALRLRMVLAGFTRYGEMEQVGESGVAFACGQAHDALMRVLLPYSRNISSVETMMAAEALRGQMTTGTLGFSQT